MKRLKCQHSSLQRARSTEAAASTPTGTPCPPPPPVSERMTTVIAWHITGSHKALGSLCVGRRQPGRKPGLSLWLVCECETPLLSGETNLGLVDSVGYDTILSILGVAAAAPRLVVQPRPTVWKHSIQIRMFLQSHGLTFERRNISPDPETRSPEF